MPYFIIQLQYKCLSSSVSHEVHMTNPQDPKRTESVSASNVTVPDKANIYKRRSRRTMRIRIDQQLQLKTAEHSKKNVGLHVVHSWTRRLATPSTCYRLPDIAARPTSRHRRCQHGDGCPLMATYGDPSNRRPLYCADHKVSHHPVFPDASHLIPFLHAPPIRLLPFTYLAPPPARPRAPPRSRPATSRCGTSAVTAAIAAPSTETRFAPPAIRSAPSPSLSSPLPHKHAQKVCKKRRVPSSACALACSQARARVRAHPTPPFIPIRRHLPNARAREHARASRLPWRRRRRRQSSGGGATTCGRHRGPGFVSLATKVVGPARLSIRPEPAGPKGRIVF